MAVVACVGAFSAWAGAMDFDAEGAWKINNHQGRLKVDTAARVDGAKCLAAYGASNKCDTALSLQTRRIAIPAGTREFVVAVEAKGSKFAQEAFKEGVDWNNAVVWYGADGKKTGEQSLPHILVPASRSFRRLRDWGKIPANATACEVRLGFDNPNFVTGDAVFYRGFSFEPVPEGQSRESEFVALWKDGAWARDILYSPPVREVPKITLRDDGVTLVDGEPFFPIGIYSVCRREFNGMNLDKAFADLKAAGFNFAHTYGNAYEPEFLAAAEKHGFKLWVAATLPDRNLLDVGRHHPAILAWYLGDDTSGWFSPQEIADRDAAVKAVDRNRITCQADPVHPERPISCYGAYVRATDVYMPEIYPVRGAAGDPTDKTCVAKTIWDMERVRADVCAFNDGRPRACWPILQWFMGWNSWQHFPSREQLRATTWAAIVHGAHGMTWYTYGGFDQKKPGCNNQGITSTPERWKTISELATELKKFSPVLIERSPRAQPVVEILAGPAKDPLDRGPSVTCLLKKHVGKDWLFAVNAAPEPVTAKITLPDGSSRTEKFAPFGVLVPGRNDTECAF